LDAQRDLKLLEILLDALISGKRLAVVILEAYKQPQHKANEHLPLLCRYLLLSFRTAERLMRKGKREEELTIPMLNLSHDLIKEPLLFITHALCNILLLLLLPVSLSPLGTLLVFWHLSFAVGLPPALLLVLLGLIVQRLLLLVRLLPILLVIPFTLGGVVGVVGVVVGIGRLAFLSILLGLFLLRFFGFFGFGFFSTCPALTLWYRKGRSIRASSCQVFAKGL
jgi:hypothetical protein